MRREKQQFAEQGRSDSRLLTRINMNCVQFPPLILSPWVEKSESPKSSPLPNEAKHKNQTRNNRIFLKTSVHFCVCYASNITLCGDDGIDSREREKNQIGEFSITSEGKPASEKPKMRENIYLSRTQAHQHQHTTAHQLNFSILQLRTTLQLSWDIQFNIHNLPGIWMWFRVVWDSSYSKLHTFPSQRQLVSRELNYHNLSTPRSSRKVGKEFQNEIVSLAASWGVS